MSTSVDSVLSIVMTLSASDQRELAERLWDRVELPDEAVFDEEMWSEIGRRVSASDQGAAVLVPGGEVLASIRQRIQDATHS